MSNIGIAKSQITGGGGGGSGGVTSVNGVASAVTLVAGTGVSVSVSGQNITIANTIGGVNRQVASYTATGGDYGKLLSFNSGSSLTLILPAVPPSSTWWVDVEDVGPGSLIINPNGLQLDGSASNLVLAPMSGGGANDSYVLGTPDAANLPNSVANPTAYYGVDAQPATAGSLDDEFNGSTLNTTRWTWANQGTATAVVTNSILTMKDSPQGSLPTIVRFIWQPTPVTPWQVTMGPMHIQGIIGNFAGVGLAVQDGGTNKAIVFMLQFSSAESVVIANFTDLNTYVGGVATFQASLSWSKVRYMQFKDDGTNHFFYISEDGVNFWQVWSQSRIAFLASTTRVGVVLYPNNVSSAGNSTAFPVLTDWFSIDWFRRTL